MSRRRERLRSLVLRARAGDWHAFGVLVSETEGFVFSVVRKRGLQDADVRDVSAEVYIALWEGLPKLQDPDLVLSWLSVTAIRVSDQHKTRERRHGRVAAIAARLLPTWIDPRPRKSHVSAFRDTALPADCREAIRLRYEEDLGVDDIAARMGCSRDHANHLLRKGRRILEDQCEGRDPKRRRTANAEESDALAPETGSPSQDVTARLLEIAKQTLSRSTSAGSEPQEEDGDRAELGRHLASASNALFAILAQLNSGSLPDAEGCEALGQQARAIEATASRLRRHEDGAALADAISRLSDFEALKLMMQDGARSRGARARLGAATEILRDAARRA